MTSTMNKVGVAIVTGAAGGMGSACAKLLAADGWPLILCDISEVRLAELSARLLSAAGIEILACNIADTGFTDQLLSLLGGRPIGALIHSAGLSPTMASAEQIVAVNYEASVRLANAALPHMAEGACAVLIASSSGYMMNAPQFESVIAEVVPGADGSALLKLFSEPGPAYALSKRAVLRLVEHLATPFGKRGARIMSISPGLIDTAMGRAEQKASAQMDAILAKTPLGRYGTADEIASVAVFLCSPGASYLSGSDIKVDGGSLAAMLK